MFEGLRCMMFKLMRRVRWVSLVQKAVKSSLHNSFNINNMSTTTEWLINLTFLTEIFFE